MTDLTDLLVEVSPSLKVGWILWLSAGLALAGWFRLARATPLPVAQPLAASPVVRPPASLKHPVDVGDPPQVPTAALSAVSPPSPEESDRPTRKSRRRRNG